VSIEFLITSLIVVVSPGTGVLYTLATGLLTRLPRRRRGRVRLYARHRPSYGRRHSGRGGRCCTPARSPSRPSNIWGVAYLLVTQPITATI